MATPATPDNARPPAPGPERYKSFRLAAPASPPSPLRLAGASLVSGLCGFVLGIFISLLLADRVFYTTKALSLIDKSWLIASAILIAQDFAVFPLVIRVGRASARQAARAALFGSLSSLFVALVVALTFASAYQHQFDAHRAGDELRPLIGPLLFLIPLVGVMTSLILLFRGPHEPSTGKPHPGAAA